MLNDIQVSNIQAEAVQTLEQRVVSKPIFELYTKLQKSYQFACLR